METMDVFNVKMCWGNLGFDYVHSDSVGVYVHGDYCVFNSFIANMGLEEVPLGGSSFTWCHKSATKMSKLDRLGNGIKENMRRLEIGKAKLKEDLEPWMRILKRCIPPLISINPEKFQKMRKLVVDAGMFKGVQLNPSLNLSHMFYADDAALGVCGQGYESGGSMSRTHAWEEVIDKLVGKASWIKWRLVLAQRYSKGEGSQAIMERTGEIEGGIECIQFNKMMDLDARMFFNPNIRRWYGLLEGSGISLSVMPLTRNSIDNKRLPLSTLKLVWI
ncbi:hypothetical protein Tco_0620722 [Tanacetum coccineum]